MTKPDDLMTNAWKQQIGVALRLVETLTEESRKLREFQLTSAVEAHASAVATREALEKAADAQDLWRIQSEWWSASMNRSLEYWREAYEGMMRAQVSLARCLAVPAGAAKSGALPTSNAALLEMMGDAYKRWLETTSEIYAARAGTAAAEARKAA